MRYISFSLWIGDPATAPKYLVGAVENVKLAKEIYPDWQCVFWVPVMSDGRVPGDEYPNEVPMEKINELERLGARIYLGIPSIPEMYWRFFIADHTDCEYFIVRDADSRLSLREKAAVDQWIESGKMIHTMRDHPAHCRGMNGGLIGAKGGCLPNMLTSVKDWLAKLNRPFAYSDDQDFLGQVIWTKFYNHAMQHDSCCKYPDAVPFPTRREGYRFVGEVFEADGTPRDGDWEQVIPNQL